jgi:sulfide:quinone oxidoreductase
MSGQRRAATLTSMRQRVVIAGSGVAAVEAVLALRQLAGRGFDLELVAPAHTLVDKPASVATPFGFGTPPPIDLDALARRYGVDLVHGELASVDVDTRTVRLAGGAVRPYDYLLVAVGARQIDAVPGAFTFRGPGDAPVVERMLEEAARGDRGRIVIAVPTGTTWTLPAYELAIMMASALDLRGVSEAVVRIVTPEREPLWIFGETAATALRELLHDRGIGLRTRARPAHAAEQMLWLESGNAIAADTVIALAALEGPAIAGLPADAHGFIRTDAHGCVTGAERVFAAGDATTFPVKQGGLATQQADAAAATIAQELGAAIPAQSFAPVLRGVLLTGGAPLYLRAELDTAGRRRSVTTGRGAALRGDMSSRALWWPPAKVAGRYLAPYLSTARPASLADEPLQDRVAGSATTVTEHDAALELALLVADEDAAAGDLTQALHALDAAATLSGGVLPAAYAERRTRWEQERNA